MYFHFNSIVLQSLFLPTLTASHRITTHHQPPHLIYKFISSDLDLDCIGPNPNLIHIIKRSSFCLNNGIVSWHLFRLSKSAMLSIRFPFKLTVSLSHHVMTEIKLNRYQFSHSSNPQQCRLAMTLQARLFNVQRTTFLRMISYKNSAQVNAWNESNISNYYILSLFFTKLGKLTQQYHFHRFTVLTLYVYTLHVFGLAFVRAFALFYFRKMLFRR